MKKEFWVNVYNIPLDGHHHSSLNDAQNSSYRMFIVAGVKTLYRIHVRLK